MEIIDEPRKVEDFMDKVKRKPDEPRKMGTGFRTLIFLAVRFAPAGRAKRN